MIIKASPLSHKALGRFSTSSMLMAPRASCCSRNKAGAGGKSCSFPTAPRCCSAPAPPYLEPEMRISSCNIFQWRASISSKCSPAWVLHRICWKSSGAGALCWYFFSPKVWELFHTSFFLLRNRGSKADLIAIGGKEDFCRGRSAWAGRSAV